MKLRSEITAILSLEVFDNRRYFLSVVAAVCLICLRPVLARTWTDSSGTYKVEAELVKLDGEVVELKKPDGTVIKVPLDKLSEADRVFVRPKAIALTATKHPAIEQQVPVTSAARSRVTRITVSTQ